MKEALALTAGKPAQVVERVEGLNKRRVEIWDVSALRFSDTYTDPVRVVRLRERWAECMRQGKAWKTVEKEQNWIWVVAGRTGRLRRGGHPRLWTSALED